MKEFLIKLVEQVIKNEEQGKPAERLEFKHDGMIIELPLFHVGVAPSESVVLINLYREGEETPFLETIVGFTEYKKEIDEVLESISKTY